VAFIDNATVTHASIKLSGLPLSAVTAVSLHHLPKILEFMVALTIDTEVIKTPLLTILCFRFLAEAIATINAFS